MKEKFYLYRKEIDGKIFYYLCFGSECHGKPSFHLWVSQRLIKIDREKKGEPFIELPCENAKIIKTEKVSLVLRPCEGWNVFKVGVECGYRGESWFEVLEPAGYEVFQYKIYHSPVGSLRISTYGLVNSHLQKIKVKWERNGRLYGAPAKGITIYYSDGKKEELPELEDGLEALEELKKLTQE